MRSSWFTRAAQGMLALSLLTAAIGVQPVAAKPFTDRPARPRAINLFAAAGLLFQVNNNVCGLANVGQVCVAFAGSPVGGGGFWPKGTIDQYIFQSGVQLAGVISPTAGFAWAGDTVGAFFVDTRGTQEQGDGLELIYDALNPTDAAAWPNGAVIRDTAIYNSVLIGRNTISQGDNWTRYWEGDPAFLSGRSHPMGIAIDQRGLAWNYPSGNQDIMYFVFTFYNVTARASSGVYNNPTIDPAMVAEIGAIGDQFQNLNEQKFGIAIPDGGYSITSMYSAFTEDADVAVFSDNYGTAVLPFNMGMIYSGRFLPEVGWIFPPSIFGAPFAEAPGFTAVKYLRSPESSPGNQVGLTMFSTFVNSATGFPDPVGVNQLYRYLSGFLGGSDNPCNSSTNAAIARSLKLCFLAQFQADARFFMSSGPFVLPPGESRTIVVAYIHAAPLAAPLAAIVGGGIGGNNVPGTPATGDTIFANPSRIRGLERVMGWVSQADTGGAVGGGPNSRIEQNEVTTAPRSLLNKALVAQAIYDNKFLLPFSPEAPQFFLVPGDNEVTVVWQKSVSEATGDPFFVVASNPTSPLYDPNFREFDVEGYRVYRGRTQGSLELIGQFDFGGTTIIDFTGSFDYGASCAPELGIQAGCPVTFQTVAPYTANESHDLQGNVIQIPPGGRVELASGAVFILAADTAVTGGGSGFPAMTNSGVPFAFTDRGVRNSFTYHYAVTAFDLNSVKSGPTSLESPRITKAVVPRKPSGQETAGLLSPQQLIGGDGSTLNAAAALPAIDPATGIFAGPMPPTDAINVGLAAFLPQVLANGSLTVTIDSIAAGMAELDVMPGRFRPTMYYMTGQGAGAPVQYQIALEQHQHDEDHSAGTAFEATAVDATKAGRFGGNASFALYGSTDVSTPGNWMLSDWGRGTANGVPAGSVKNGVRWWAGAPNENTNDPNGGVCGGNGACGNTSARPIIGRTAGQIAGVTIAGISAYNTVPNAPMRNLHPMLATVVRAADFRVHWGAGGLVDSVVDVTHRVRVPFSTRIGPSWGILTQGSFAATTAALTRDADNAKLTWSDIFCVAPSPTTMSSTGNGDCGGVAQTAAVLVNTATLTPIAIRDTLSSYAGTAAAGYTATGNGFIFYLAGHFTLMQMAALPAAGTVWNVRTYAGSVTGAPGTYAFTGAIRPAAVPGLRIQVAYQGSTFDPSVVSAAALERVHTVPDPYYVTNALEFTQNSKVLKFVNMPSQAIVRIYSVSGVLVNVLTMNDPTGGGELTWNLRNRNNQFVASGVYFYHVETPDGKSKVGRFTIVTFAP